MSGLRLKLAEIANLEQLALNSSSVHRRHAAAKLGVTVIYLICLVSLDRHDISGLPLFLFYPAIICGLGGIPARMIASRAAVALPFIIFTGLGNCWADRSVWMQIGDVVITGGMASFVGLIFMTLMSVSAVVLLMAITPMHKLNAALRQIHVPVMMIGLVEMMYRYLGVLLDEAATLKTAWGMRRYQSKLPGIRDFGCLAGHLLLRSIERAERIWVSMQMRGYDMGYRRSLEKWNRWDTCYVVFGGGGIVLMRILAVIW